MYNHSDVEKEVLSFWEKNDIYKKAKEQNTGNKPFYFCDGPPYATGHIHPGTGWNKVLKDAICRYERLKGKDVRAQPGYDTHGLPIEVKVEQELGFKAKKDIEEYGVENFIKHCKQFATKYINIMNEQFKSIGIWMDFDNPYITYKDSYIDSSWRTIKQAHKKGLLTEGVYVLPYCYRCETTMANYELEYGDETDPSVFVKFKVKGKNEFLIIWTTTPWTLPANMAVMANPDLDYVKVDVNGEVWILAKSRLEPLMDKLSQSSVVLEEVKGKDLEGVEYEHPLIDVIKKDAKRRVVLSEEYVSDEDGTGLVHTAPGHGPEDFMVGKKYGLEIFCPVDDQGRYTDEVGELKGKNVRAENPNIIKLLEDRGALVYEERVTHRYPHCWRCKTPLIFLATKQWFITISKMKDRMLEEVKKTNWNPQFAKERFLEFVSNAPDWCISRQRYWGIPLPIWKCSCGEIKVIGSKKELPVEVKELHRPYVDEVTFDCECGNKMYRVKDVLDVWFDSGNAVWAPLTEEDIKRYGEVADLILEGQDQIRGWFYSLLGSGIIRYDKSPYKQVVMHGFFVDQHGEKMSKSLGNFIPLEEILEKYGADAFRMWSTSNAIWDELKFSWDEMKKARSDLNIVVNLVAFLERFYKEGEGKEKLIDSWLLSRLNTTKKNVEFHMSKFLLDKAVVEIRKFITEDVSRFYLKLAKDRINSGDLHPLKVLYGVMLESLKLLSIVAPFTSEHLYQRFYRKHEEKESLFLLSINDHDGGKIDAELEKEVEILQQLISQGLLARQDSKIKLRWPIANVYIQTKNELVSKTVTDFKDVLKEMLNAKEVTLGIPSGETYSVEFDLATISIDTRITEDLYEEGMLNEVKRRIQLLRKKGGFKESETAKVSIYGEAELLAILKKQEEKLKNQVNAIISYNPNNGEEYLIDGRKVVIKVER